MDGLDERLMNLLIESGIEPETWEKVARVPTGSLALDFALSGGWPRGRWSVIWGDESSGKSTTLLLSAAAETQRGGNVAYIDVEHSFDENWAARIGVDRSHCYVTRVSSTEEALNKLRKLINTNAFSLIIFDSIGAMSSLKENEGDIGDVTVAINARLLKDFFGRVTPELERTQTAVVFINQLRFKIGGNDPDPETMPGGQAFKHAMSIIVKLKKRYGKHVLTKGDDVIGNVFAGRVTKNKVGPPQREFEFTLRQDEFFGVDMIEEAGILAKKLGILTNKEGGIWTIGNAYLGDRLLGNGVKQVTDAMYKDPDLFIEIESRIREALHGHAQPVVEAEPEGDPWSNNEENLLTSTDPMADEDYLASLALETE
jgi:recombination protein RecA